MKVLSKLDNTGMINEVVDKRYVTDAEKLTWNSKSDTDTVTTINGKTGAISKADIVALGIPAQDTVYTHPASHPASMITDLPTGKKVTRFVVGTSTAGWTSADCDYLCDGTADQTEINAAITALPATGGEVVILDGIYNIAAKIDVTKNNVSIRGNGNTTILKRMFDSSIKEGVITLTSRSGCKIANLQIEGNKTSYTNNNNYGIYLYAANSNTVTGNACNNNNYGIYLSDSSNNNNVPGNTCYNNNSSGITLINSSGNAVTSNTCNNNNYGIYLSAANSNTVTGNTCNSNSNHGIYFRSSSSNNTVTGNACNNNVNYGINLDASSNNTVTGNTCNNNNYGINLSSSSNNTVTGNTCIRGTGLTTDYTENQHTIRLNSTANNYNLISNNNCMGKAVTNEGGTGNSVYGNKYDSGGGVATLDSNSKVPTDQIPNLNYIPTTEKAAAGGVASLGADGKVPEEQLPPSGGANFIVSNINDLMPPVTNGTLLVRYDPAG